MNRLSQIIKELNALGFKKDADKILKLAQKNTISSVVNDLVDNFNVSSSGDTFIPLDVKSPGFRAWSKLDGTKYRDPGTIMVSPYLSDSDMETNRWSGYINKFYNYLRALPGAEDIGKISGEFRSSPYSDVLLYKNVYFALTPYGVVEYGSKSRFKNTDVWKLKKIKEH